ncbi:hypothetical protein DYB32_007846 [Aphanomyces invadans]|uniref:Calmodulin n=1 Tax=Aphanomyces invadans TaxID=157072 RepID=A0A3R6Y444_9STRA|nr:hypothetical protein DYB32_007846 [Aphanomyces invadans]
MASRYAKNIKVPAEFPELLRSFAREVLRQQDKVKTRADILQFGIKYFTDVTEKNSGVHNGPQNEKEVYMTMSDDEIEEYMWQIFRASDPGSVGDLDEGEFKRVCASATLHQILSSRRSPFITNGVEKSGAPSGDEDSTGFLSFAAIKTLLRSAGLGLTRIQIIALMSEAQEEDDDAVAYERFVKNISTMALHFLDYDHQAKMAQIVPVYRSTEEYFTVQGMNQHEFEVLTHYQVFKNLGILVERPRDCNAFPKISSKHVSTLLALGDVDANGDMEYAVTIHNGFQALQWIQEYETLGKQ